MGTTLHQHSIAVALMITIVSFTIPIIIQALTAMGLVRKMKTAQTVFTVSAAIYVLSLIFWIVYVIFRILDIV